MHLPLCQNPNTGSLLISITHVGIKLHTDGQVLWHQVLCRQQCHVVHALLGRQHQIHLDQLASGLSARCAVSAVDLFLPGNANHAILLLLASSNIWVGICATWQWCEQGLEHVNIHKVLLLCPKPHLAWLEITKLLSGVKTTEVILTATIIFCVFFAVIISLLLPILLLFCCLYDEINMYNTQSSPATWCIIEK